MDRSNARRARRGRGPAGRRLLGALAALGVIGASLAHAPAPAAAQTAPSVQLQVSTLGPTTQPSGSVFRYLVEVSCSATASPAACEGLTVTVPFASPIGNWQWGVENDPVDPLVLPPLGGFAGNGPAVLALNDLAPGSVRSFILRLTPPNLTTPDGTTWSLTPELDGPGLDEPVDDGSVSGTATATPNYNLWKRTPDNGTFYQVGTQVTYELGVTCINNGLGSLHLEAATVVDTLPAGVTFVSASHGGTHSSGVVTWDLDPATLPSSCGGATGNPTTTILTVTVQLPPGDDGDVLNNTAQLTGTGLGGSQRPAVHAAKSITLFETSPPLGGNIVAKSSYGPLTDAGSTRNATYAGAWITPASRRPSTDWYNPDHEGSYHLGVNYGVGGFQSELVDPVPCLDNLSGSIYSSNPAGQLCANPAFHVRSINLANWTQLAPAHAAGFRPEVILTDGTVVPLQLDTGHTDGGVDGGQAGWFLVPSQHVGSVAAIRVPRHAAVTLSSFSLRVFGYVDASVPGGHRLDNRAQLTAYWGDAAAGTVRTSPIATIRVLAPEAEVGLRKQQSPAAGASSTVYIALTGTVAYPIAGLGDVVVADLLPDGYSWANPGPTQTVSLSSNGVAASHQYPLEVIEDHGGSGRTLVRVTIPAADLGPGSHVFTITFAVTGPTAPGTYLNDASVFVNDVTLRQSCRGNTPSSSLAAYAADDPEDLDGDGAVDEDPRCVASHTLVIPGSGPPAFNVTKTVQGDLDAHAVTSPMVGNVSAGGGTATYRITWTNVGTGSLSDAVVYDVLPYVGDVGLSGSEASTPRGSDFATTFVSAGPLPAGVTIEYSGSTDPCRSEVNPAADATCTDDWTTDPDDLGGAASVRALRLRSVGPHVSGGSFSVAVQVATPAAAEGAVAWNTVAAAARLEGQPMLATESPRVGVQVPQEDEIPLTSRRALAVLGALAALATGGLALRRTTRSKNLGGTTR